MAVRDPKAPLSTSTKIRYALYGLAVTVAFFAIADGVITALEERGVIQTTNPDDQVSTLTGNPWHQEGDRITVTPAAAQSMVPMSFAADKGERFRVFLVGGSFMRGVPYAGAGTIRFWLHRELERRFPETVSEVVNAAATSQNSNRVRDIAQHALDHDPDALIIATCNNEGALPPSEVQKRLVRSGTFRLLKRVLKPERTDAERPLHTPQDPDIDAVRDTFRQNLETMVREARARKVPVFLCTLPLNLRYDGNARGRSLTGGELPDEVSTVRCVDEARRLRLASDAAEAIRVAEQCDDLEALREAGLAHYALRADAAHLARARELLTQYTEVQPRNRCRQSFQAVIRQVAAAEKVPLIDLQALVDTMSEVAMPGPEQFASYCHVKWEVQAQIADAMLSALESAGVLPTTPAASPPPEDRAGVFARWSQRPAEAIYPTD